MMGKNVDDLGYHSSPDWSNIVKLRLWVQRRSKAMRRPAIKTLIAASVILRTESIQRSNPFPSASATTQNVAHTANKSSSSSFDFTDTNVSQQNEYSLDWNHIFVPPDPLACSFWAFWARFQTGFIWSGICLRAKSVTLFQKKNICFREACQDLAALVLLLTEFQFWVALVYLHSFFLIIIVGLNTHKFRISIAWSF